MDDENSVLSFETTTNYLLEENAFLKRKSISVCKIFSNKTTLKSLLTRQNKKKKKTFFSTLKTPLPLSFESLRLGLCESYIVFVQTALWYEELLHKSEFSCAVEISNGNRSEGEPVLVSVILFLIYYIIFQNSTIVLYTVYYIYCIYYIY